MKSNPRRFISASLVCGLLLLARGAAAQTSSPTSPPPPPKPTNAQLVQIEHQILVTRQAMLQDQQAEVAARQKAVADRQAGNTQALQTDVANLRIAHQKTLQARRALEMLRKQAAALRAQLHQ